jgi:hypothetical protein
VSVNRPEEGHHEALSFAGTDVLPPPQFGSINSFYPKEKADDQFIIVILEMILDLNLVLVPFAFEVKLPFTIASLWRASWFFSCPGHRNGPPKIR